MFHRRRKNTGRTNGKIKGKSRENAPNNSRKRAGTRKWQAPNKKKTAEMEGKAVENGTNNTKHETDKKKIVLCRVVSELSLVPASLCHSIRQEEDFVLEMLTA